MSISPVFGGIYSMPKDTSSTLNFKRGLGFGGGLVLGLPLGSRFSVESGALLLLPKYDVETGGSIFVEKIRLVQVPVLLRMRVGSVLTVGGGGYVSKYVGNIENINSAGTVTRYTYAAYSQQTLDYGVMGAFGVRVPWTHAMRVFADLRYQRALRDVDKTSTSLLYHGAQFLLGFHLSLGSGKSGGF